MPQRRFFSRLFFLILTSSLGFLALAAWPDQALAWGPGVHMVSGNWVLQNLSALSAPVAAALMRYPGQFLHGCLSADIFIGKGSVAREGHSHNWSCGFDLLTRAGNERAQAYAYGYLAHLAADTVAHNVYVPGLFDAAPGAAKMAHVYLEAQADRTLAWDSRDACSVFLESDSRDTSELLRTSMGQTALTFWIKKHMFRGSVALGGTRAWRGAMEALDRIFPEERRVPLLEETLTASTRAILSVLRHMDDSPVLSLDPVGTAALAAAKSGRQGAVVRGLRDSLLRSLAGAASPDRPVLPVVTLPEILAFPPVCTAKVSEKT